MRSAPVLDEAGLDRAVAAVLHEHPAVGLAVAVVANGELAYVHGHGVADLRSGRPVTEHTGFRVASITKTVTAVAIMQLQEQGMVDLDSPAQQYLRSFRLVNADPTWPPATVRQLLTHTAGLRELAHPWGLVMPDFGESVPVGRPVPSLSELYGGSLRVVARPGSRFVYGNHSPATLGQIVEDVSGLPLAEYVRRHITVPLGMDASDMTRSPEVTARLATGYEIGARAVREISEREMATVGAAGLFSTPRDMARYLAALLGGGSTDSGRILSPASVRDMVAPQYQPHPRIPGMGLAFFRHDVAGHRVVGHQGTHPGFHSQILLAPDDGVGVLAFTNGGHLADFWLPAATMRLLRQVLAVPDTPARAPVPHRPETWPDLVGWYRLDAHPTDTRLRAMLGLGVEVDVRGGSLRLRFLSPVPALARGFPLVPDDPHDPAVYLLDLDQPGLDPMRVVFAHDDRGQTTALHLDIMPLTLPKQPDRTSPRRWTLAGIAGAGAVTALAARRWRAAHT